MAEINADANDVISVLSDKLAASERENAILLARLHAASQRIDALENPATAAEVASASQDAPKRPRR